MSEVVIGAIVAVASVAVSAYSAVSSANAKSDASDEARKLRRTQAEQSRIAAEQRVADYQKRSRAALATERTQRGASGIGMQGSPLLTYWENAKTYEEDISRLRQGAALEQTALGQRGALERSYGQAEEEAGYARLGQTLLTGGREIFTQGHIVGAW